MDMEIFGADLWFPEGPVVMQDGSVLVVEIRRQTLTRVRPGGVLEIVAELGGGPNGAAIGPDGAAYICNNGGFNWREDGLPDGHAPAGYTGGSIQRVDLETGAVRTLYTECDGEKLVGPNDLVFDAAGGMWFSDHGKDTPQAHRHGGLYYALPDGSKITRVRKQLLTPNGVGLSPDGRVLYMADTMTGRLWAMEVAAPGELGPAEISWLPGRAVCTLPGVQYLDSLAVEASGKICVATLLNGGITVFDPDGAHEHVAFPDMITTNIAFGGEDMRDAYVTCSSTGTLYKCRWPRPGLRLEFNA